MGWTEFVVFEENFRKTLKYRIKCFQIKIYFGKYWLFFLWRWMIPTNPDTSELGHPGNLNFNGALILNMGTVIIRRALLGGKSGWSQDTSHFERDVRFSPIEQRYLVMRQMDRQQSSDCWWWIRIRLNNNWSSCAEYMTFCFVRKLTLLLKLWLLLFFLLLTATTDTCQLKRDWKSKCALQHRSLPRWCWSFDFIARGCFENRKMMTLIKRRITMKCLCV